jgi:hypothetical protein
LEVSICCYKVETRGAILDEGSQIKAYVDDVVIKGRRLLDDEEVLVVKTNKTGLEINGKKTKFVIAAHESFTMRMNM